MNDGADRGYVWGSVELPWISGIDAEAPGAYGCGVPTEQPTEQPVVEWPEPEDPWGWAEPGTEIELRGTSITVAERGGWVSYGYDLASLREEQRR